jgi:hypothetical protein
MKECNLYFWLKLIDRISGKILNKRFFISGLRFGLLQTKVGLISLLSKYQFCISKKTAVPLVFDTLNLVLTPLGTIWLHIKKRVK